MKWSFQVGKIAGTRVKIHLTFVLLLAWVGVSGALNQGIFTAVSSLVLLILIFLCVLLHEFGHVIAALRYGITTPKITLFPFGGVATVSHIPKDPRKELFISFAGPLTNILLAVILLSIRGSAFEWNLAAISKAETTLVDRMIWVNVILAVFNLIPAFPLDGGRIFRALLSFAIDRMKATFFAVRVGQGFAIAGAFIAVFAHQPFLFLIALFLFFAAGSEASMAETEHALEGLTACDASMGEFHTVEMDDTVDLAIKLMLDTSQPDFPVVNHSGQCIAIATRQDLIRTLREKGAEIPVREVVQTLPAMIDLDVPALDAWRKLVDSKLPGAAVVDSHGKLARWLTRENISELILSRTATLEYSHRQV
ncbi:MAG: site-2 protease family protein [Verrucomicrobiales bacterium]|nr:site-2 protease family protein [Verrucomicrobiales bacterium]